jgi:hypothetical protein
MSKKKGIPFRIHKGTDDKENPEAARWQAHLDVWKQFRTNKTQTGLVFEDDANILTKRILISDPPYNIIEDKSENKNTEVASENEQPKLLKEPVEWKMLYLGGNVQSVYQDTATDKSQFWKRVSCLTTHAYIVHYRALGVLIKEGSEALKNFKKGVDGCAKSLSEWLCTQIHPNHEVYMATPDFVIQTNGYSDVRKKDVTYNQILTETCGSLNTTTGVIETNDIQEIDKVPFEIVGDETDKSMQLNIEDIAPEDLPHVTLVTPTRNNLVMFRLIVRDFYRLSYPREKLAWIIVDDGDDDQKVKDIEGFPHSDQRISYVNCKMTNGNFLSYSKKLNIAMGYASSSAEAKQDQKHIIVHFFDDQHHPAASVSARVKCLIDANRRSGGVKQCIGCTHFGVFDYVNNQSYQKFYPDINNNPTMMFGPSLAYYLKWHDQRKFEEDKYTLETFYFTRNRLNEIVEIPYNFVSVQLVSGNPDKTEADRYTSSKSNPKTLKDSGELTSAKYTARRGDEGFHNFFDGWDKETQNFVLLIKELEKED